jgi:hypothetical protein
MREHFREDGACVGFAADDGDELCLRWEWRRQLGCVRRERYGRHGHGNSEQACEHVKSFRKSVAASIGRNIPAICTPAEHTPTITVGGITEGALRVTPEQMG